jgi:hypothetical protein
MLSILTDRQVTLDNQRLVRSGALKTSTDAYQDEPQTAAVHSLDASSLSFPLLRRHVLKMAPGANFQVPASASNPGRSSKSISTVRLQTKRKGGDPPHTGKRGRWEQGPSVDLIAGAQNAQITGGTFALAGRDHITIHNHLREPIAIDVLAVLRSFGLPNFRAIQQDTIGKAVEGTCVWLTEGEVLRIWIEKGMILWGTGIRE